MRMLKVRTAGEGNIIQAVDLKGDRRNPEPESFKVGLPFGEVVVTRTTDDEYWVHVWVHRPHDGPREEFGARGVVKDGRIDCHGRNARDVDPGLLADPGLFHLAVRLGPDTGKEPHRGREE